MTGLPLQKNQQRRTSFAFSLVELLVVIAIIGILAGLILPSLALSKEKAQRAKCASNLKQLGYALQMYVDEYNNTLPGPMWQGVYHLYNNESERAPYYLSGYLGLPAPDPLVIHTAAVMICPAAPNRWKPLDTAMPPESLDHPVSYSAAMTITNSGMDVLTHPFGFPYSSPRNRFPSANKKDEPSKKLTEIKSPFLSRAITDVDRMNVLKNEYYINFLPEGKVHLTTRNQLFFDWHVQIER